MALKTRQAQFVQEYLVDLNASAAAVRCGYSKKNSNVVGPRLLASVGVRAAINAALAERSARTTITSDGVITSIQRVADAAEANGELANALKGLELLGKHLKLFTEKVEVTGKLTLEQLVMESYQPDAEE